MEVSLDRDSAVAKKSADAKRLGQREEMEGKKGKQRGGPTASTYLRHNTQVDVISALSLGLHIAYVLQWGR